MRKFKIDGPLDAFAVHGACGFWGVMSVGFFCRPEYFYSETKSSDAGIFFEGTTGLLFATQLVTALIEISWVVVTSFIMFTVLDKLKIYRVLSLIHI